MSEIIADGYTFNNILAKHCEDALLDADIKRRCFYTMASGIGLTRWWSVAMQASLITSDSGFTSLPYNISRFHQSYSTHLSQNLVL